MLRASEMAVGLLFGLGCGFAVVAYVGHGQPLGQPVPMPAAARAPAVPPTPAGTAAPGRAAAPTVADRRDAPGPRGSDARATPERRRSGVIRCVGGKLYWIHKQGGVTVIEPYPPQPPDDCRASCS